MDWNIARKSHTTREPTEWTGEAISNMNWQYGGAALLADLITAMSNSDFPHEVKVITPNTPNKSEVKLDDSHFVHSYAVWAQYRDKELAACRN